MTTQDRKEDVEARTVKGFCAAYGIGHTFVYALMKQGLPTLKVGGRRLIPEPQAREWLYAKSGGPQTGPQTDTEFHENNGEQRRKRQYHKSRLNARTTGIS